MNREQFLKAIERFWANVQRTPDGCWPWMGEITNKGYGSLSIYSNDRRHRVLAHRLSVVIATGADIDGRVVMHTCDNPPCVNPDHLRVGTQADNMRDALSKGRLDLDGLAIGQAMPKAANAKKTACKHGHDYTPENTYLDRKGYRRCRECAHQHQRQRTEARRAQRLKSLLGRDES